MALYDFLNAIVPSYAKKLQRGCVEILEHESDAKIKRVEWTHSDFHHFDHTMCKDLKPFFEKWAKAPKILYKDCDGIIMFEHDGKKYMFLTELKSTFDTNQLLKAKKQIISSFIKTNMVLNLSACYHLEDYIVKGFVISRPPTSEFLRNLRQVTMLPSNSTLEFVTRLFLGNRHIRLDATEHKTKMKPTECQCLKGLPLGDRGIFSEIEFYHIAVPAPNDSISLDIRNYL